MCHNRLYSIYYAHIHRAAAIVKYIAGRLTAVSNAEYYQWQTNAVETDRFCCSMRGGRTQSEYAKCKLVKMDLSQIPSGMRNNIA